MVPARCQNSWLPPLVISTVAVATVLVGFVSMPAAPSEETSVSDPPFRVRWGRLVNTQSSDHVNGLPSASDHGEKSSQAILHVDLDGADAWEKSISAGDGGASIVVVSPHDLDLECTVACDSCAVPDWHFTETKAHLWSESVPSRKLVLPSSCGTCKISISKLEGVSLQKDGNLVHASVILKEGPKDLVMHSYLESYDSLAMGSGPIKIFAGLHGMANGVSVRAGSIKVWDHDSGRTLLEGSMESLVEGKALFEFEPSSSGYYYAQVSLSAGDGNGFEVLRSTHHLLAVVDKHMRLVQSGAKLQVASLDMIEADGSTGAHITLNGVCHRGDLEPVKVYGEVWVNGQPHFWIRSIAKPRWSSSSHMWSYASSCTLSVRASVEHDVLRKILQDRKTGAASLRSVRIQNRETNTIISRESSMELTIESGNFPTILTHKPEKDKEEMKTLANTPKAPNLMLVHGYCADKAPWPTEDFWNYAVFEDFNQARSNDDFARRIAQKAKDSGMKDFSIIAHSQGGLAALHMMTFYDTGLHLSDGVGRAIQSVGSPYQGTELAGNVAALGHVFGVGCGKAHDLTHDGAAQWLETIPPSDRSEVYYYTTSFTSHGKWHYDYCDIVTDELLPDPDDGVVSKKYAQLPGGNNMGHTQGWCHTTGMAYPACYTDHDRNYLMNSLAQR